MQRPASVLLRRLALVASAAILGATPLAAHPSTLAHALLAQASPVVPVAAGPRVPVTLELRIDADAEPVAGLVRITPAAGGEPLALSAHLQRPMGWFSLPARATVDLPPGSWRIEACHGLETAITTLTHVVPAQGPAPRATLRLRRLPDPGARQRVGGNTHLHLRLNSARGMAGAMLRTRAEAEAYLRTTAQSDGLDLVYVSHLERVGETQHYVSNEFTADDLRRWSGATVQFANGEEHRHEGGRATKRSGQDELRYGHVLFLDLPRLVPPASYGAIFMPGAPPDDSIPMRRAILEARAARGTIVWCHGKQGTEDVANWTDGLLHAQNIFDGGSEGSVETVFYPYLNAGLRVPFSTGTDWGMYDFSRVYVPRNGPVTSRTFLQALSEGRSFITNGTLLEFDVEGQAPGDTLALPAAGRVRLRGRGVGRDDFVALEVVFNGRVVARVPSRPVDGHFEATVDLPFAVTEPGWFALRLPATLPYTDRSAFTGAGANLFGKALFAHTSAVYVTLAGRAVCQPEAVDQLITEAQAAIRLIEARGAFASDAARDGLLSIYRAAIAKLEARKAAGGRIAP
ncbi:MAG: CehA/McbA family metallohydrolase [Opitutaceae bacterium]|nr:CehA/McbA family metallohydrolase [Opitutaceae bacterium]